MKLFSEPSQEKFNFFLSYLARMQPAAVISVFMKPQELLNPVQIGLLRRPRILLQPRLVSNLIKKFRLFVGLHGASPNSMPT